MATISATTTVEAMRSVSRRLGKCRVVDVALTNIADADTYSVGPGCVTAAFIDGAAAGDGKLGMILDRSAQTITFDCAGTQNGTLRLFYGQG